MATFVDMESLELPTIEPWLFYALTAGAMGARCGMYLLLGKSLHDSDVRRGGGSPPLSRIYIENWRALCPGAPYT